MTKEEKLQQFITKIILRINGQSAKDSISHFALWVITTKSVQSYREFHGYMCALMDFDVISCADYRQIIDLAIEITDWSKQA